MIETQGAGVALTIAPFLWTLLYIPLEALIGKSATIGALTWIAPALWHLLALWACYRFVEVWIDRKTALWSALLLFGCPMFMFFSFFYMTDIPLAAMTLLTCWAFALANEKRSAGWSFAALGLAFLTCGVKMIGVAIWPILLGLYPTFKNRSPRALAMVFLTPALLAAAGIGALALAPGGPSILSDSAEYANKIFMSAIASFVDPSNSETNVAHSWNHPLLFLELLHGILGFPVILFIAALMFPRVRRPAAAAPAGNRREKGPRPFFYSFVRRLRSPFFLLHSKNPPLRAVRLSIFLHSGGVGAGKT